MRGLEHICTYSSASKYVYYELISVANNRFKAFRLAVWLVNLRHYLLEGFFQNGGHKSFLFRLIDSEEILKNYAIIAQNTKMQI
jgi:hypothetical protein